MLFSQVQKDSFKMITYFFKPYKLRVVGVFVAMMISGALESINLAALYPIINFGLQADASHGQLKIFNDFISRLGGSNPFLFACILLVVISCVAAAFKLVYSYWAYQLIQTIDADIQKSIFNRYALADYRFFVHQQQGRLIYASTTATNSVSNLIFYVLRLLNGLFLCLFFSTLLLVLAWQGTLLLIGIGVVYVLLVRKITTGLINHSAEIWTEQNGLKNVILNEFITGIKSIKIFLSLPFWKKRYDATVDHAVLANFRIMMGRIYPDTFIKFVFFMLVAVVGIAMSSRGHENLVLMLPTLATFGAVASRLFPYINMVGGDFVAIARFMPDTRVVHEALTENVPQIRDGHQQLETFQRQIVFDRVWFRYEGSKEYLLKGLSFTIPKDKITAIVGPSGSGKTTIISLLLKLYEPLDGCILVDESNLKDISRESYLSQVGYVGQETFIFNGTIRDNIVFGLKDCPEERVMEAARLANAHEFIMQTELGYDTKVGDAGVKLSGGQRQRLAIARAMLRRPQILILDEATSSLDTISERVVQEAINNVTQHTTVLVIAHRLSTVQNADQIIVLDKGEIVEQGTHQGLLERKKAYYQLYTTTA
jgi:ABC-type multidrug transport system fused ATPase/permease subunit